MPNPVLPPLDTSTIDPPPQPPSPPDPVTTPDEPVAANGVPAAVLALTDGELRLAAAYYPQKHQKTISRKGVEARQARMNKNLDAITAYIQAHGSTQIPRLSRKLNLSPRLTSHYLQILVKQGRLKANGWQKARHYYI